MEYLILDEDHSSLTRAVLRTPPTANILEFEVPEKDVPLLEGHVDLQFLGFDEHSPSFAGKVTRRRGNRMAVEKGADLGDAPLENLRVLFEHDAYIYPVSGTWQGRVPVRTQSLSCGTLGFLSRSSLALQEVIEVTVHTREGALLVQSKIIQFKMGENGFHQGLAQFISGVDDVERLVRKEVLYLQLKQRDDLKEGKRRKELYRIS